VINIREITEQDLAAVSAICIDAFITSVAGSLSAEGITTFTNIAACTAFQRRMAEDNLLLVAEYDGKVAGVVELKQGRHVAMLFVAPAWQKNGIGKQLLAAVLPNARVDMVTVKASLSSVPAYQKYGFECKGDIAEFAGLVYLPMEIDVKNRRL